MSQTLAQRTARMVEQLRPTILANMKRFDLRTALARVLLIYDKRASFTEGLFDPTTERMTGVGDHIIMLYTDGSRLRVGNDLVPHIIPSTVYKTDVAGDEEDANAFDMGKPRRS